MVAEDDNRLLVHPAPLGRVVQRLKRGLDGKSVGDQMATIKGLKDSVAAWTAVLAAGARPRNQFNPPESGPALGACDIRFHHN